MTGRWAAEIMSLGSRNQGCTSAKEGMEQSEMFESQDFDSSWWRHWTVETQLPSDMLLNTNKPSPKSP